MRHRDKNDKLSRSRAQRKALIRCLVRSLFIHERIKTTPRKAKVTSSKAERLITLAKRGDLASKRLAFSFLQDHRLVKKLFEEIAPRFKDTPGGCTRMMNLGFRKGDGAKVALLELTEVRKAATPEKKAQEAETKPLAHHEHATSLKEAPKKTGPSKSGLRQSLRKIFKKERDAL
ncbi:50S ribosomal protein L17 [Candidatus Omnitrophota bacterium]